MAVNKVDVNGSTVLDLTSDSVTPKTLVLGSTAHNAAGEQITGTYEAPEEIFWATYGVTTFSEIKEAYDAGKAILMKLPGGNRTSTYLLADYMYANIEGSGGFGNIIFSRVDTHSISTYATGVACERYYVQLHNGETSWSSDLIFSAAPSRSCTINLLASNWNADTKTQTINDLEVVDSDNGSLRIAQSATDEQFAAWGAAQPRVTKQGYGSITVKLAGTVPTIDIPVEVLIV